MNGISDLPALAVADFPAYFQAVHEGHTPFPWQERLVRRLAEGGDWPALLDLPTAAGKTAALDAALFHLALAADSPKRTARRRIALVVDRRLVVDSAYERAERIRAALEQALKTGAPAVLAAMAKRLLALGGSEPVQVARLRGGIPKEDLWTRDPAQPLILLSTVDQLGSRLLFRGYGVSEFARPIHAGLLAEDTLLLLDEAHLSAPFLETLRWVEDYLGADWRKTPPQLPLRVMPMTATPGSAGETFGLDEADRATPALRDRLQAAKPARLVAVKENDLVQKLAEEARKLKPMVLPAVASGATADLFGGSGTPVIGVIVNRVATARAVFALLDDADADRMLLTGRNRPLNAQALRDEFLPRMQAGRASGANGCPLYVVATQTVEVGADLDFDALVTESAPLDALRQRFGRLNRLGRAARAPAVIVHARTRDDDPIYGPALLATWNWLDSVAVAEGKDKQVDFGIEALARRLPEDQSALLTPRKQAPVLLPAYVDRLAQTSTAPALEPDLALLLHGPDSSPAEVQLIWRADLPESLIEGHEPAYQAVVAALPPSALEALSLPVWTVRAWLQGATGAQPPADIDGVPEEPERDEHQADQAHLALRWLGEASELIAPKQIRPGDTLILPAAYGGLDRYGWNPAEVLPVSDLAESAANRARKQVVLRLAPGCVAQWSSDPAVVAACRGALAVLDQEDEDADPPTAGEVMAALAAVAELPVRVRERLTEMNRRGAARLSRYGAGYTEHWLLHARRIALEGFSDEDDDASLTREVLLESHCAGVGRQARRFAEALALPEALVDDLTLAGELHDLGKADPRFQTWLRGGERAATLGAPLLAKSALDRTDRVGIGRARQLSGYPRGGRHECASVQLLRAYPDLLAAARDRELVEYLVGAHHGRGRPFMPVVDDPGAAELDSVLTVQGRPVRLSGPHGLERLEAGWTELFWTLIGRYGWWGLAYLEAVLRLADHRRSAEELHE